MHFKKITNHIVEIDVHSSEQPNYQELAKTLISILSCPKVFIDMSNFSINNQNISVDEIQVLESEENNYGY